jgi:hypothetical protein
MLSLNKSLFLSVYLENLCLLINCSTITQSLVNQSSLEEYSIFIFGYIFFKSAIVFAIVVLDILDLVTTT